MCSTLIFDPAALLDISNASSIGVFVGFPSMALINARQSNFLFLRVTSYRFGGAVRRTSAVTHTSSRSLLKIPLHQAEERRVGSGGAGSERVEGREDAGGKGLYA